MAAQEQDPKGSPKDRPLEIRTKEGTAYEVPPQGSLGLLALGYLGLMAWRKARGEQKRNKQQ